MRKGLFLSILVVLVLVAVVWIGVPALIATDWARGRVANALQSSLAREVEIGDVDFRWVQGLVVEDVRVSQRDAASAQLGPLFTLEKLAIDVSLLDLVRRRLQIDELSVEGPRAIVVRDERGRLNVDDLLQKAAAAPDDPGAAAEPAGARVYARLRLAGGELIYVDRRFGTRIMATAMKGEATWRAGDLVTTLAGKLNGGDVRLRAHGDFGQRPSPFWVEELTVDGASLTTELRQLGYLVPLLGVDPQRASGTLSLRLSDIRARGFEPEVIIASLSGAGEVELENAVLASGPATQLVTALRRVAQGDLTRLTANDGASLAVERLRSVARFDRGTIRVDPLRLEAGPVQITAAGATGLDGALAYDVRVGGLEAIASLAPQTAKLLADGDALPLRLTGTLTRPRIGVDADAVGEAAARALGRELQQKAEKRLVPDLRDRLEDVLGGTRP